MKKKECLIRKFYELQVQNPTRGDWASSCDKDLYQLGIKKYEKKPIQEFVKREN